MSSLDSSLEKTIDNIFQLGFKHHQEGRLADAHSAYEQILSLNPHHFDALHLSGLVAAQTGQANMAVDYIQKALEINAADPSAHKNLGIALHSLERYEEAIHRALSMEPNDPEAYYNIGNAYLARSIFDEAIASFEKTINLAPSHSNAHLNLGIAFYELGLSELAIASYDLAIGLNPSFSEAFFSRGLALEGLKQLDAALVDYDRALIFNPEHHEARQHQDSLLRALGRT